ncbi:hypothetical protein CCH79_00021039 [Gambusia affinis]|uniref:Uncharacterized protein n=1 Tax=Gambusia affinis TaxID=33528 RepID=A0A315VIL3_GAMAF|nr:hypothetical protein CCH79_00021039 [Gambusia affinis]
MFVSGQVAVDNAERLLSVPEEAEGELDLYLEDSTAPPGGQRRSNGPVAAPRSRRFGPVVPPPMEVERGRPHDLCGCLRSPPLRLQHCLDCGVLHDITCVHLTDCSLQRHQVEPASGLTETGSETGEERPRDAVPEDTAASGDTAASHPISYHCEAASANPHLLCLTCRAVHTATCVEGKLCHLAHRTRCLGMCSCGKSCCGTPRVLCLYCGDEFCRDCWYKNPLTCVCGRSFHLSTDLSTSV